VTHVGQIQRNIFLTFKCSQRQIYSNLLNEKADAGKYVRKHLRLLFFRTDKVVQNKLTREKRNTDEILNYDDDDNNNNNNNNNNLYVQTKTFGSQSRDSLTVQIYKFVFSKPSHSYDITLIFETSNSAIYSENHKYKLELFLTAVQSLICLCKVAE
jgi:hypothetical protein